jgi:hypothetical protein
MLRAGFRARGAPGGVCGHRLQRDPDAHLEALLGEGRARDVATQSLEPLAIAAGHGRAGSASSSARLRRASGRDVRAHGRVAPGSTSQPRGSPHGWGHRVRESAAHPRHLSRARHRARGNEDARSGAARSRGARMKVTAPNSTSSTERRPSRDFARRRSERHSEVMNASRTSAHSLRS